MLKRIRKPSASATDFVQSLLAIEVNTVIKSGLTARKMPPIPLAILDIAGKYYWYLESLYREFEPRAEALSKLSPEIRTNGKETFDTLRVSAEHFLNHRELSSFAHRASDHVIVERIYRTCTMMPAVLNRLQLQNQDLCVWDHTRAQLMGQVRSLRGVTADHTDLAFIRKAWEVGTEHVIIQTTVQLDGDIVTRIHPHYVGSEMKQLHALHLELCRTGVATWKTMAKLALDLIQGALAGFGRLLGLAR